MGIKRPNKRKKQRQSASCCVKLLEDGFPTNGVEHFCDVHLQHHPIEMHNERNTKTMNHYFTPTPNYHTKLMR
jgi:hypothetical protein